MRIKRILMVLAVAAMVVAPGVAGAQDNASQFCKDNDDFGVSHGACVSFFASEGKSSAVIAEFCKDPAVQEFVGLRTTASA